MARVVRTIILSIIIAFSLVPIIFTLSNSFMSQNEIINRYTQNMVLENANDFSSHGIHFVRFGFFPEQPTISQYKDLLTMHPEYLRMIWNSIAIVIPIIVGQCLLAPIGAFAFEISLFTYKEIIYFVFIIVMILPSQILLVPNFIAAEWMGINDSYLAIILPAIFHPLGIFLIRQQIKSFPQECLDAAALDGAGVFRQYLDIIKPNITSVISAMVVLLFSDNWNLVDQAVVFIKNRYNSPICFYLGNVMSDDPSIFFAVSVFSLIPPLVVFLLGQEKLYDGVVLTQLKG